MADLSKVKVGTVTYNLKDAQARTDIAAASVSLANEIARAQAAEGTLTTNLSTEVTRATGAESGLDTRIKALESKGRYLSTWNAETGKPDTYPQISQLVEGKYNYRAGDYYIVNKVAAENNLMPDGAYISYDSATTTWTVPTKAFSGTLNLGDQFQYDGTNWTHIASATTVAFKNIQGDAEENTNLKGKLDAKVDDIATGDANGQIKYKKTADGTYTNVDIKGLANLAYKSSASGQVDAQTISGITASYTPEGSVTVVLADDTAVDAVIAAKAAYTPAGTIKIDSAAQAAGNKVLKAGSITVTVKDAAAATAVTDLTYDNYTPAGGVEIAAATDGLFQVQGTNADSVVTVNTSASDAFVKSLKAGDVDAAGMDATKFSGGSFTGATAATFTQGSKAAFTQGAKAELTTSNISYVEKGVEVAVDKDDAEMLVFTNVTAKEAKAVDTFTANGDDSFTPNGDDNFVANNVGTFTPAVVSAGFVTSQKLPVVDATGTAIGAITSASAAGQVFTGAKYTPKFTGEAAAVKLSGAKYLKQEIATASFSGTEAEIAFDGTQVADLIPSQITYKPKKIQSATFAGTAGVANVGNIVVAASTVTVE